MKSELYSNENILYINKDGLHYIKFKNLNNYDSLISHCFTTRIGGVSTGECTSLNFGFNRNDSRGNVIKNYEKLAQALEINLENLVLSNQVHDNKIRVVTFEDRGKGITKESDIIGYDGLVTNIPDVALVTFYADCVPVFFLDPMKKVIGLVHSGWRGTVKEIACEMVEAMKSNYLSETADIVVAIGPSIGKCCFEVGEEAYYEFLKNLPWSTDYIRKTGAEKWHINLQGIIKKGLTGLGISEQNISTSDICTKCCRDIFYSYRGDEGKTGSLIALMQLK